MGLHWDARPWYAHILPNFFMEVDTATDCHLHYTPIRRAAGLVDLDYVQPKYTQHRLASITLATPPQPT